MTEDNDTSNTSPFKQVDRFVEDGDHKLKQAMEATEGYIQDKDSAYALILDQGSKTHEVLEKKIKDYLWSRSKKIVLSSATIVGTIATILWIITLIRDLFFK